MGDSAIDRIRVDVVGAGGFEPTIRVGIDWAEVQPMWTWTSVLLTINPALSPPHVPTTSVMCAEVAAEQAIVAKTDRIAEIRVMSNAKRVVPLRSSLT